MQLKRQLSLLLLPVLLCHGCRKADTQYSGAQSKQFAILGAHDVVIGGDTASYLVFHIARAGSDIERITVSVEGLPPGIEVDVDNAGGTENDFYMAAVFTQKSVVAVGSYPIRIAAASASFDTTASLNLLVRPLNGWSIDGKIYRRYKLEHSELLGARILSITTNDDIGRLDFQKIGAWPLADGTYHYPVGDLNKNAGVVGIECMEGRNSTIFSSSEADTTTLTLVMQAGKATLSLPSTALTDGNTGKALEVSVTE